MRRRSNPIYCSGVYVSILQVYLERLNILACAKAPTLLLSPLELISNLRSTLIYNALTCLHQSPCSRLKGRHLLDLSSILLDMASCRCERLQRYHRCVFELMTRVRVVVVGSSLLSH